jgi:predicted O-methyltransferase YrrM
MRYIGDLSRNDAALLHDLARRARAILEFGAGASTQIIARACDAHAMITTLETDAEWIEKTRTNLRRLNITKQVEFVPYKEWVGNPGSRIYDLILDDGIDKLRLEFALKAWPLLRVGGLLLLHDTRRRKDFENVLRFVSKAYLEVASVQFNTSSSNLTLITKKTAEPWEDWNLVEGRERWEYAHEDPPPDFESRWERRGL